MKRRSFFTALAAVAAVLLISGLAGFAWLLSQSSLSLLRGSPEPNPQAMMFIPKQAPAVASLMTNIDQLEGLQLALVDPDQRRAKRAEIATLRDGILGNGLDYHQDVQPWLGDEITLAITTLDIDRDPANGNQPGYLLSLATKNSVRSREFLQLFWQKRSVGQDLAFEQYQGTQIIYGQMQQPDLDGPPLTLASAVVGDRFVLFANSPKVLRAAINSAQAVDLNLGNDPDYQTAIATLPKNRIGLSYLNLPQLAALSGDARTNDQLNDATFHHLTIGLAINRQGLIANTVTRGGTAQMAQLDQLPLVLRYLPANAPMAIASTNLAQTWSDFDSGLKDYQVAVSLLKQPIAAWEKRLQLNLAQDLLPWIKGDYALGLLPTNDQSQDWILIIDKATNPDYAAGLAKLDEVAKQQNLTPGPVKLGEQTVSAWTQLASPTAPTQKLDAEAVGAWADLDQVVVIASSIDAIKQALTAPDQSLRQSTQFTQAIAPLERQNNGYFYLDWPMIKPVLLRQVPLMRWANLVAQPLSKHLKSLTLSGYGGEADVHRGAVFLRLR